MRARCSAAQESADRLTNRRVTAVLAAAPQARSVLAASLLCKLAECSFDGRLRGSRLAWDSEDHRPNMTGISMRMRPTEAVAGMSGESDVTVSQSLRRFGQTDGWPRNCKPGRPILRRIVVAVGAARAQINGLRREPCVGLRESVGARHPNDRSTDPARIPFLSARTHGPALRRSP